MKVSTSKSKIHYPRNETKTKQLRPAKLELLLKLAHPCFDRLSHALLEGKTESAVAAVAALARQLPGSEGTPCSDGLAIEVDEMADAQVADVGIVGRVVAGEVLTEIESVGAKCQGKLGDSQVVL